MSSIYLLIFYTASRRQTIVHRCEKRVVRITSEQMTLKNSSRTHKLLPWFVRNNTGLDCIMITQQRASQLKPTLTILKATENTEKKTRFLHTQTKHPLTDHQNLIPEPFPIIEIFGNRGETIIRKDRVSDVSIGTKRKEVYFFTVEQRERNDIQRLKIHLENGFRCI